MLIYLWTESSNTCQQVLSFFLWDSVAPTSHRKPSEGRHFCDYITFSWGTTTQAFEELGFSRAQAPFISQELLLTLRDVHWSWRPLKENAFEKKTKGPEKPAHFPTAQKSTFHWFGLFGWAMMRFDAFLPHISSIMITAWHGQWCTISFPAIHFSHHQRIGW